MVLDFLTRFKVQLDRFVWIMVLESIIQFRVLDL